MLAKQVVREFGDQARYVDQDFGDSPLADRFGVTQYPAVFVDDALIARPQDFYAWSQTEPGRYQPFIKNEATHRLYQDDLRRAIQARLRGEALESVHVDAAAEIETPSLPALVLTDLAGAQLETATLGGRVVVVEVWAPWCPPCLTTLGWLGGLEKRYGDRLAVLALGVAAPEESIRKTAGQYRLEGHVVLADDALLARFGPVNSVPTLYVFGPDGRRAAVFYGAPPDLHEKVEAVLEKLLAAPPG